MKSVNVDFEELKTHTKVQFNFILIPQRAGEHAFEGGAPIRQQKETGPQL